MSVIEALDRSIIPAEVDNIRELINAKRMESNFFIRKKRKKTSAVAKVADQKRAANSLIPNIL
ncbi:MAG: hypothetical protein A2149_03595 [Candidatus Schekmanbacteria bacterium RBG_16_38_11]|uniref:Uncharacterized protein n=1 Tax=Candidatus Schekmanbacteria bacterium RBG_16_38_11 TaxID=1817880 RepID=A0A1F7RXE9_9BACT|nr:MAG: hypothetical protein A2149_03595 [Candidatus Schekmanbacteria bacterium RBG_16_38_11]